MTRRQSILLFERGDPCRRVSVAATPAAKRSDAERNPANRIPVFDSDSDSDSDADQKQNDHRCWRALVVIRSRHCPHPVGVGVAIGIGIEILFAPSVVPTNEIQPIGSLFSIPIPIPIPTPIRNEMMTEAGELLSSSGLGIVPIRSGSGSLSRSGSRSFSRHPWFPRTKSSQSDPYFRFRFRFRFRRRSETR